MLVSEYVLRLEAKELLAKTASFLALKYLKSIVKCK